MAKTLASYTTFKRHAKTGEWHWATYGPDNTPIQEGGKPVQGTGLASLEDAIDDFMAAESHPDWEPGPPGDPDRFVLPEGFELFEDDDDNPTTPTNPRIYHYQ